MSAPTDAPIDSPNPRERPFHLDVCPDLAPLRRALETARYEPGNLAGTVTADDGGESLDVPVILLRTAEPSPYHTLVRLFALARGVPKAAAREALAPMRVEPLIELGLLRAEGDEVRATAALFPFEDLLLVRDFWPQVTPTPPASDYVPGVGPSSMALANLTVRGKARSALDLGTGSGVQALWTAARADRVVGTDTNRRALGFAALNARLNGRSNIELRPGSLYEPVAGEQFDRIAVNPPYVISPEQGHEYRDSGMAGDGVCQQVIRGAAPRLCEGGYATVIFNWHHKTDDDWAERPSQWLDSSGCDAWLLCSDTCDPIAYAADWIRRGPSYDPGHYPQVLDAWLAYYRHLGIGRVSWGAVILRRRTAETNWLRADKSPPGRPSGSCSDQIQRVFAAEDLLEGLDEDRRLLDLAFQLTADHQLQQVLRVEDEVWTGDSAALSQTRGFAFDGQVDQMVIELLAGCQGRRRLGELVTQLAGRFGVEFEQLAPACISVARNLLRTGFLSAVETTE